MLSHSTDPHSWIQTQIQSPSQGGCIYFFHTENTCKTKLGLLGNCNVLFCTFWKTSLCVSRDHQRLIFIVKSFKIPYSPALASVLPWTSAWFCYVWIIESHLYTFSMFYRLKLCCQKNPLKQHQKTLKDRETRKGLSIYYHCKSICYW